MSESMNRAYVEYLPTFRQAVTDVQTSVESRRRPNRLAVRVKHGLLTLAIMVAILALANTLFIAPLGGDSTTLGSVVAVVSFLLAYFAAAEASRHYWPRTHGLVWRLRYLLQPSLGAFARRTSVGIIDKQVARHVWYWREECLDTTHQCLRVVRALQPTLPIFVHLDRIASFVHDCYEPSSGGFRQLPNRSLRPSLYATYHALAVRRTIETANDKGALTLLGMADDELTRKFILSHQHPSLSLFRDEGAAHWSVYSTHAAIRTLIRLRSNELPTADVLLNHYEGAGLVVRDQGWVGLRGDEASALPAVCATFYGLDMLRALLGTSIDFPGWLEQRGLRGPLVHFFKSSWSESGLSGGAAWTPNSKGPATMAHTYFAMSALQLLNVPQDEVCEVFKPWMVGMFLVRCESTGGFGFNYGLLNDAPNIYSTYQAIRISQLLPVEYQEAIQRLAPCEALLYFAKSCLHGEEEKKASGAVGFPGIVPELV